MQPKAYTCPAPHAPLSLQKAELSEPKNSEVLIEVSHCGICHSDIHLIDDDWKIGKYPLVPGHEIVGVVKQTGAHCEHLRVGDRVGVGWQRNSCGHCEWCLKKDENLCPESEATCIHGLGGFSTLVVIPEKFAFKIPEALPSELAAPLLCAGITVYTPLMHWNISKGSRVGVLGIGGLGHLALQFAKALGAHVTAFSQASSKSVDAKKFGADHVVEGYSEDSLNKVHASFDFLLSTVHADLPWSLLLKTLRPDGKLCFVGIPPTALELHATELLDGRKSICGSPIGGTKMMQQMLEFATAHGIHPQIEKWPWNQVNEALERVRTNKARYRIVLG